VYADDRASKHRILCGTIAAGRYRAPDPIYRVNTAKRLAIRRVSANTRKLEMDYHSAILLDPRMLGFMSHELANVHLGSIEKPNEKELRKDLKARPADWLLIAVEAASHRILQEQERYEQHWRKSRRKA